MTIFLDSGEHSNIGQENCLRLYALQTVSAEALRKVFEDLHVNFEVNLNQLKDKCRLSKNQRSREMLSRNYFCLYFSLSVFMKIIHRFISYLYTY